MNSAPEPAFIPDLMAWYTANAAPLPWRLSQDPYRVWLSEIMLQQTQVETVKPYFERFLQAFPTVQDLAAAPLDDVLKMWEGLGYYSRARNLHRAAQMVTTQYLGVFPQTAAELLTLPGVGRYTAGAIASIAFGEVTPVLDGNVMRVFARLTDLADDVTRPATQKHLWDLAEAWMPADRPGDYNQALMELGRTVCKPRNPLCETCPIQRFCLAYAHNTQHQRPVKRAKAPTPHYDMLAGIIWNELGELLIVQRPQDGLLGGLWELPNVQYDGDLPMSLALQAALSDRLGLRVAVDDLFVVARHAFTHFKITLHAYTCHYEDGEPQTENAFAWVAPEALDAYFFGKADRIVIEAILTRDQRLF